MNIKKFRDIYPEKFEITDYYCPICGKHVKPGSFIHRCSDLTLKRLENKRKKLEKQLGEDGIIKKSKTFSDILEDGNDLLNPYD